MTEIPDDEVEAAAEALERTHWNGEGCGTNGQSGCLYCYGPSPADSREIAKMILAAVRPRWEKQLAELHSDVGALKEGFNRVSYQLGTVEAERDDARAELERVRAAANDALARAEDTARRIPSPFADNVVFAVRAALRQLAEPKEGES